MIYKWQEWLVQEARRPSNNFYQQLARTIIESLRQNPNPSIVYKSIEKQVRAWMKKSKLLDLDTKILTPLLKREIQESDIPTEQQKRFLTAAEQVRVQFGSLAGMLGLGGLDIGDDGAEEFTPEGGIKGDYHGEIETPEPTQPQPRVRSATEVTRTTPEMADGDALVGAKLHGNINVHVSDDGFGPLWIYRNTMGVQGVVRAETWHAAYEAVIDAILNPIPEDEVYMAYGFDSQAEFDAAVADYRDNGTELPELAEGYHYQSNSTGTGIVSIDLNGDALDKLTTEMMERLNLTVEIEPSEVDDHESL